MTVTLTVNGRTTPWSRGLTVADVVATLTDNAAGIAAAVNDTVVPRGSWSDTPVEPGDRVEVLTAVQGG